MRSIIESNDPQPMQFEQLLNLASALRPDLPPTELYELAVLGLADLSRYDHIALWLRPNEELSFDLVATVGFDAAEVTTLQASELNGAIINALRMAAEEIGEAIWWRHSAAPDWSGGAVLVAAAPQGHTLLLPLVYTESIGVMMFVGAALEPDHKQISFVSRCVDQVAIALTAALIVAERAKATNELRTALAHRQLLLDTVAELSTPILPLHPGVLLLPLVSNVDTVRMDQIAHALLHEVSRQSARIVLLDVTGVPIVDTQVAGDLIRLARSVQLLGGQIIIVGIRPEIAQTLVSLGVDVSEMTPRATLAEGLRIALAMLGWQLVRREQKLSQRGTSQAINGENV